MFGSPEASLELIEVEFQECFGAFGVGRCHSATKGRFGHLWRYLYMVWDLCTPGDGWFGGAGRVCLFGAFGQVWGCLVSLIFASVWAPRGQCLAVGSLGTDHWVFGDLWGRVWSSLVAVEQGIRTDDFEVFEV